MLHPARTARVLEVARSSSTPCARVNCAVVFQSLQVRRPTTHTGHTATSFQSTQCRQMAHLSLNNLKDNAGAMKKIKRVGRGPGSGMGKMSTKGHKGSKARSGGMHGKYWFEGGQTPIHRRVPKHGFNNASFSRELTPVNLVKVVQWIQSGRIDPTKTITMRDLAVSNAVNLRRVKHGVKLLGRGIHLLDEVPQPLHFEVSDVSEAAKLAIEQGGGSVKLVWFNRVTLRAHLRPHKFAILPRSNGIPPPKLREKYAPYMERDEEGNLVPPVPVRPVGSKYEYVPFMKHKHRHRIAMLSREDQKGFAAMSPAEQHSFLWGKEKRPVATQEEDTATDTGAAANTETV